MTGAFPSRHVDAEEQGAFQTKVSDSKHEGEIRTLNNKPHFNSKGDLPKQKIS